MENRDLLKEYLNNYNKEQLKCFIRYLANYYLNNFEFYDLSASFNYLAREIDDNIPSINTDAEFETLLETNPYYFLYYLTLDTVVDTLLDFIAECDIDQFLYVAEALNVIE